MRQHDQRMSLAATISKFELANRLVALSAQPLGRRRCDVALRAGRVAERKELVRVLIDWPLAREVHDIEQIGCEFLQRESAGPHILANANDLIPGLGGCAGHCCSPCWSEQQRL